MNCKENNELLNFKNPEACYLMGIIWADGCINKNSVSLYQTDVDALHLIKNIKLLSLFKKYRRQRYRDGKEFGKPSHQFCISSTELAKKFNELDFDKKSYYAPTKVLNLIPEKNKHYFWRGYFDGDGCLYINSGYRLYFWSTIDQDWSELFKLYNKLNIEKYSKTCYERKNGKHKSSVITISRLNLIEKLCNYMYGKKYDNIGLYRKYDKFIKLKKIIKNRKPKTSKYIHICFNKRNNKWKSSFPKDKRKHYHFGWFDTEEEAYNTQQAKIKELNLI